MVVSLGADLALQSVPGLVSAGFNVYTLDGAAAARDALRNFEGGVVSVVIGGARYKCPAAPYETALLVDGHLRRLGIRSRCEVHMFAPEQQPLPVAGPAAGQAVVEMLLAANITYHPGSRLTEVHGSPP